MVRVKGFLENWVIYVYVLRNVINFLVILLGFEFVLLLSGLFIVEYFFNWLGLGSLILEVVRN